MGSAHASGRHDFYPFGAEINAQPADALLIDGFESGDLTAWGDGPDELAVKYTSHERDLHRLSDYMKGRTCLYPLRRFASPDRGRDGWNLYSYTLNNPVRYVDPEGDIAETAWDAFNLGLGLASLAKNIRDGNVGGALLDGAGVVLDGLAAATPFVPGGAGAAIKAGRAAGKVADGARAISGGTLQKIFMIKRGKGNFGIGKLSKDQADELWRAFVGPNAIPIVKNGQQIGLRSPDGLRTFRFPAQKKIGRAAGRQQANIEEFLIDGAGNKVKVRNAHIDIIE